MKMNRGNKKNVAFSYTEVLKKDLKIELRMMDLGVIDQML